MGKLKKANRVMQEFCKKEKKMANKILNKFFNTKTTTSEKLEVGVLTFKKKKKLTNYETLEYRCR